jgi:hypothetical protein
MSDICDLHRKRCLIYVTYIGRKRNVIRSDKQLRRDENYCRPRHRRNDNDGSETFRTTCVWLRTWTSSGFLENVVINIWIPQEKNNFLVI